MSVDRSAGVIRHGLDTVSPRVLSVFGLGCVRRSAESMRNGMRVFAISWELGHRLQAIYSRGWICGDRFDRSLIEVGGLASGEHLHEDRTAEIDDQTGAEFVQPVNFEMKRSRDT